VFLLKCNFRKREPPAFKSRLHGSVEFFVSDTLRSCMPPFMRSWGAILGGVLLNGFLLPLRNEQESYNEA
jgi:hypothetical protein